MDWELLLLVQELQSFLGFVTYVRQHIRHIAELTAPLEAIKNRQDYRLDYLLMLNTLS